MKQEDENKNEKDDIDKYIENIVNKKISEPEGFEKAIREALYSDKFNKKLRKRQIIRTISTACATVILTSGVAIGGYIVYEKVWKEPKQYTYDELKSTIADTEVSDEEKKDLISEEQAKQTALEIAKNLGYENEVVESISDFGVSFNKVTVSLKRIGELLNNELYKDEVSGSKELENTKGVIKFNNVKFKYKEGEDYTLNGLNLEIVPNKKIAIVGRSGNGKSTIFNLLLRYFDASIGTITIDGINIKDLTEESLRGNISIIRQSPFLFNLSILDNFRLVKEDVSLEEVREYCKRAYIDDYIMSLPKGYDTVIGEGGINLSGGQKQRLAIARTLLLNTKIILFDEATSALDNESQEYIKKTIDDLVKDHTVIIVAHRLSTIVDADTIHIIEKGKLVGSGTHKELLKSCKQYQNLYTAESN